MPELRVRHRNRIRDIDASTSSINLRPEPWTKDARCNYDNMPTDSYLGRPTVDARGNRITREKHATMTDRAFFGEHDSRWATGSESAGLTKAVNECLRCPVRNECLEYSFEESSSVQFGVFGGATSWERRAVADPENPLLSDLDHDARVDVLRHLVDAKAFGLAPYSVRLDFLKRHMEVLTEELTEEWTEALEAAARATDLAERLDGAGTVKDACPRGHPYNKENSYIRPGGKYPVCRKCDRARGRDRKRGSDGDV